MNPILITGIMASGKSTIAQHLAEQLPKSVHLRGDIFRRMIVNGRAEMGTDFSPEAYDQLLLRYQLAALTAKTYQSAGFTVVYQDVIIGAVLNEVIAMFGSPHVVVLCPSPEVAAQRDANRHKTGYTDWSAHDLDRALRTETPHIGLWLDNSTLSIEATVARILEYIKTHSSG